MDFQIVLITFAAVLPFFRFIYRHTINYKKISANLMRFFGLLGRFFETCSSKKKRLIRDALSIASPPLNEITENRLNRDRERKLFTRVFS